MIEKISENLYRKIIPLPNNPLKELNSYIITGKRNLIIDLGFNRIECQDAINDAFRQLGISIDNTDIFITHLHSDHCGLLSHMDTGSNKKYCSREDADIINASVGDGYWDRLALLLYEYGYPLYDPGYEDSIKRHPGRKYSCDKLIDFTYVSEGQVLDYGGYKLECISAPGHTPGLMCLYDREKKILFSADHVLGDITPNISMEIGIHNPLKFYFDSLDKVSKLEVKTLLTAHRKAPESFLGRIDELKKHHQLRLEEGMAIVKGKKMTAFQVASHMKWDIRAKSWDHFPIAQKWFATGEAAAHLEYLFYQGKIFRENVEGRYYFSYI